ncbi:MAG: SDR family oxidoreductase [SAR324 cluster bacterium]|nr:SDR family oxidoreductase [SAR324 cluster bacterium]
MSYLKKKVSVVTGASSGIGRELAIALANEGCHVALADIDLEGLKDTEKIVREKGIQVASYKVDVSNLKDMQSFSEQVLEHFGSVDILVNNAGIVLVSTIEQMEYKKFQRVMDVNFGGVFNGITAFLPHLKTRESAHIVNISSVFGLWAVPTQAAYNCSKFAVRALSEALVQELDSTSVSVSCVYPGGIQTNIAKNAHFQESGPMKSKAGFAQLFDRLAFTTPQKAAEVIILEGIKQKKKRVLIGPDAYVFDMTQRLFPSLYQKIIPTLMKRL